MSETIIYKDIEMEVYFNHYEDEMSEDFGLGMQRFSLGEVVEIEKVEILGYIDITDQLKDADLERIREEIEGLI